MQQTPAPQQGAASLGSLIRATGSQKEQKARFKAALVHKVSREGAAAAPKPQGSWREGINSLLDRCFSNTKIGLDTSKGLKTCV